MPSRLGQPGKQMPFSTKADEGPGYPINAAIHPRTMGETPGDSQQWRAQP